MNGSTQRPQKPLGVLPGILALLCCAAAAQEPLSVVQLVRRSADLVASNRLDEAEALAQRAVQTDPAYAQAWRQLGSVQALRSRHPEAAVALRRAVQLDPRDAVAWRDLGWALWSQEQRDAALLAFGAALTNGVPGGSRLIAQVVGELAERGESEAALALFREWAPQGEFLDAAQQLVWAGRTKAAEPLLQASWDAGENPPVAGLYLALCRAWGNDFSGALDRLSPFVERGLADATPSQMNAFFECLRLCSRVERFQAFLDGVETALAARPDHNERLTEIIEWAALARRDQDDPAGALRLFERAIARDPNRLCWLQAYNLKRSLEGRAAAFNFAGALLTRGATSPAVLSGVAGAVAEAQGDWSGAAEHYRRSLDVAPDQPELHFALFTCYLRTGQLAAAAQEAVSLEQQTAINPAARFEVAEMWDQLGETERALEHWQMLHLGSPDVAYYGVQTAAACFKLNRPDAAIAILTNMVAITPAPAAFEWLATIESACGRPEAGAAWAQQGLAGRPTQALRRLLAECAETAGLATTSRLAAATAFLEEDPGYVPMALLSGRSLADLGRSGEAALLHERLLSRNPEFYPALVALRDIVTRRGDLRAALSYARTMRAQRPWDMETLRRLAVSLGEARRFRAAFRALRRVARRNPLEATPILLYRRVVDGPYPGLNTATQAVSHIERLAAEGYRFVTPDDVAAARTNAAPGVMLVFVDPDRPVLAAVDAALARAGGRAVYAGNTAALTRAVPERPTPPELAELQAAGRWFIASGGPEEQDRVPVTPSGALGNPLTHPILQDGRIENAAAYSNRLQRWLSRAAEPLDPARRRLLAYPAGDGGQLSLDTTPENLAILRAAVAAHFHAALMADDSGFFVRGETESLWPGREVPPAWDADDLLDHVRKGNPLLRSRVDLAKLLYWQGQHETAGVWFQRAAEAGADPAELAFNWGCNAFQQGDLRTALIKLREAHRRDARDPRIQAALDDAVNARRPSLQAFVRSWSDNEDRGYLQWGGAFAGPVGDVVRLGATCDRNLWERVGLGDETGTRAGLTARWHVRGGTWAGGSLWRLALDDLADEWGGRAHLHMPNRWLSGHVEIEAGHEEIETVEALRADIFADHYALRSYSRLLDVWDLYADIVQTSREDGNDTAMLDGRLVRRLKEWPFAGLGYRFRLADSDFDTPDYWAPVDLRQHQIYGTLRGAHGRLRYSLSGEWGYAREADTDWREVWGCRAAAAVEIVTRLELSGELSYYEGPEYDRLTWVAGVVGRF